MQNHSVKKTVEQVKNARHRGVYYRWYRQRLPAHVRGRTNKIRAARSGHRDIKVGKEDAGHVSVIRLQHLLAPPSLQSTDGTSSHDKPSPSVVV